MQRFRKSPPQPQTGFTLVELMIVLAMFLVSITQAAPSLIKFVQKNRMTTDTNSFVGTLNYARTQAIITRKSITVCKSDNGTSCGNAQVEWEEGWIVFIDENGNGSVNNGDTLLRAREALNADNTLRGNNNVANRVTFAANGLTGNLGTLVVCDERGFTESTAIVIAGTGRVRTTDGPDSSLASCFP